MGLKNKAIEISKAAIDIDPKSYKAYCNIGYVYSKNWDVDKAIDAFKKASHIKKDILEPHYCLGTLYIKKGDYKRALDEYNKVLESGGLEDFNFYNALALVYIKNNRLKDSEDSLIRSLILNAKQFEPHNNLGNLYSMFGYFDLAVEEYKKALEMAPDNKGIRDNLKKAKIEWKKALKDNH
jgi:tetratricopeptide (TPR) repeat protein